MSPRFTSYEAGTSLDWNGIRKCVFLNFATKDIVFCWVSSLNDIKGNEKADFAAKSALDLPRTKVGVPYSDF